MIEPLEILLLIVIANSAPVAARLIFSHYGSTSIDLGHRLKDGQYLFGSTKTWRGLLSAIILTSLFTCLLDDTIISGLIISISAMLGDLLSSFIKRRLSIPSSKNVILLDQLPESLFPVLIYALSIRPLELIEVIVIITLFIIIDSGLSTLLNRLSTPQ